MGDAAARAWTTVTDRIGRHAHVVVEGADGQGFALFGGSQARHQYSRLYLNATAGARTRIAVHRRSSAQLAQDLCRRYGLVVFCGGSMPPELKDRVLSVPVLVEVERDTPAAFSGGARWSDSARTAIRKITRAGFTTDVSDGSWAAEFHEHLLVPSMTGRHGAEARVEGKRHIVGFAGQSGAEFVRVLDRGTPVAAYLNQRLGDVYHCARIGWLNGDEALLKSGAVAAAYWFSMQRASSLGCARVSFGACLPYLTDGVMRHKGQWGARLAADGRRYGEFRWLIDPTHPTCKQFLQRHAIIARGSNGEHIVLAGRSPAETDVPRSLIEGVNRWYVWRHETAAPAANMNGDVPLWLRPWLDAAALAATTP